MLGYYVDRITYQERGYTMFCTKYVKLLVVALTLCVATSVSASSLSKDDLEHCMNRTLNNVLAGRMNMQNAVDFTQVLRQVLGPAGRSVAQAELEKNALALAEIYQPLIDTHAHRFQKSMVQVKFVKPRRRSTYIVEGVIIDTGTIYSFTVGGFFRSSTDCKFYNIWIEGARSMVRYLKEHSKVQPICENLTGYRC